MSVVFSPGRDNSHEFSPITKRRASATWSVVRFGGRHPGSANPGGAVFRWILSPCPQVGQLGQELGVLRPPPERGRSEFLRGEGSGALSPRHQTHSSHSLVKKRSMRFF